MATSGPALPVYELPVAGHAPLAGVRVVDFTRVLAGPFGTQILGDLGADVIKIENPAGGDDSRSVHLQGAAGGESAFFLALNRSKRSVAVDLKSDEGREVVLDLIGKADVLIENFTGAVMRRFKLDYPSLRERFPGLIYCSVSAYGRSGAKADAAGYDYPISAEAGLIALNADAGSSPTLGLTPVTDISTALNATIGVLAALQARTQTGRGQHVDVSMFASALANLTYNGFQYLVTGQEPPLTPAQTARPRGRFETADGAIVVLATGAKMFRAFCLEVAERPEWLEDPRWADEHVRMTDTGELIGAMRALFKTRPSADWVERCRAAGVPCGVVRTPGEALSSPEAVEAGLVFGMRHPAAGIAPGVGHGFRLSDTPVRPQAPPMLGQHTREILSELLGYDAARIQSLAEQGAVSLGREA